MNIGAKDSEVKGSQIGELRFLVAEDHDFQRDAIVSVLTGLGAKTVHQTADGHGALAILRNPAMPIDIVISDLDMPGMDGMEFLRHLGDPDIGGTAIARRASISIILASALERKLLASIATMSEAYGINLLGVVEKPLTRDKLAPLIALHSVTLAEPSAARLPRAIFTLEEIATGLRRNEFEPFFQPKIELSTGKVTGVEALARWRHPQQGIIAPYAFIPLLEENGLIDDLAWIIFRKAAAFCMRWRATGLNATVSVNLSIKSLSDIQLAERITELVGRQNLEPRHMVLELTESAVTTDVGKVLENLARLRMKGFGLSIDDYGTGYSSMQQLSRIAFTELKIDQSFVTNAAKQASARVILESSLEMARKLNITSVAEGVETQEALDLLRELRCDMAQGYFIARPMEYAALLSWVQGRK